MNATIVHLAWIAAGGVCGALARYGLSGAVARLLPASLLPWGTLAVNVLGSLLIGLLAVPAERTLVSADVRAFLMIGLLGAFTTFSTFSLETVNLLLKRAYLPAVGNVLLHLLLCLTAVAAGMILGRMVWPPLAD